MGLNVLGKKKLRKLSWEFDMDFQCGYTASHYVYRVWVNDIINYYVNTKTRTIEEGTPQLAAFNEQGVFNGFYV